VVQKQRFGQGGGELVPHLLAQGLPAGDLSFSSVLQLKRSKIRDFREIGRSLAMSRD
jgi:hypothetical protein